MDYTTIIFQLIIATIIMCPLIVAMFILFKLDRLSTYEEKYPYEKKNLEILQVICGSLSWIFLVIALAIFAYLTGWFSQISIGSLIFIILYFILLIRCVDAIKKDVKIFKQLKKEKKEEEACL